MKKAGIREKQENLKDDYATLEIWSMYYCGNAMREYIDDVAGCLSSRHPGTRVIGIHESEDIESREGWAFKGYAAKMYPGQDLYEIKKTCVEMETDEFGRRISDIDIYYKGRKISRKPVCVCIKLKYVL